MRDPDYNTLVPYARNAMRCPACGHAGLDPRTHHDELRCDGCDTSYPGLGTVPDLSPGRSGSDGALRRAAAWQSTSRWARQQGRPTLDRWARASGEDLRPDWLTSWLRPAKGPVLVLCSGSDRSASDVARWMGVARVIGLDHNLTLLRATQQSPLDPGLAYVRTVDGPLPFQDGSAGAVLAMGGLHQAKDPLGLVVEAGRVLAPGGSFVGSVHLDHGPAPLRWLTWAAGEPPLPRQHFVEAVEDSGLEMLSLQIQGITALFAARRQG